MPFKPENHSVRRIIRVVHTVFVGQQRTEDPTQFEQLVPVLGRTRQATHVQTDHEAGVIHGHFGHQSLETAAVVRSLSALPLIVVDHQDAFGRPAPRCGPHRQVHTDARAIRDARAPAEARTVARTRSPAFLDVPHAPCCCERQLSIRARRGCYRGNSVVRSAVVMPHLLSAGRQGQLLSHHPAERRRPDAAVFRPAASPTVDSERSAVPPAISGELRLPCLRCWHGFPPSACACCAQQPIRKPQQSGNRD